MYCRVHKRFRELRPDLVPKRMTAREPVSIRIPLESFEKLPELRVISFQARKDAYFIHLITEFYFRRILLEDAFARFSLGILKAICHSKTF